ncbi:MAG TPA: LysM peptidoglycan-binding domain-containing protein [Xanthomonadaceae bacterium]|nr:LysM peptidoglycan-binding domain-containing protein [Xanthomonadaceae bacterium]
MFKRISHASRTVVAAALLTVGVHALAQDLVEGHPDTYVVQEGDTLWSIAGKFLQRPWLWPEIWQANPQISNPHAIYPGDVISLAYGERTVATVQAGPRGAAVSPVSAIPLSEIEPFLKDLRVVDGFEHLPYVVALEEDRLRATSGEVAYVRGLTAARPGERFNIVRPTVKYAHIERAGLCCDLHQVTDLDSRGKASHLDWQRFWSNAFFPQKDAEMLGYELMRVNGGTVTRGAVGGMEVSTLLLDDSGFEVRPGDRLVAVDPQPYDLTFFPHAPARQLEYGRIQVMAVADGLTTAGPRSVVAISAGAREGIDNGTVFSIWRVGSNIVDPIEHGFDHPGYVVGFEDKVRLPDEFAGHVMVFRTFDKVSYGLVMDSIRPTQVGYELKHPDAPY